MSAMRNRVGSALDPAKPQLVKFFFFFNFPPLKAYVQLSLHIFLHLQQCSVEHITP